MGKFDKYFKVRRNTIFERARFNRRSQQEGESAEQYITKLYELIEFCEYGELEEMLHDRLVVGIQDRPCTYLGVSAMVWQKAPARALSRVARRQQSGRG